MRFQRRILQDSEDFEQSHPERSVVTSHIIPEISTYNMSEHLFSIEMNIYIYLDIYTAIISSKISTNTCWYLRSLTLTSSSKNPWLLCRKSARSRGSSVGNLVKRFESAAHGEAKTRFGVGWDGFVFLWLTYPVPRNRNRG